MNKRHALLHPNHALLRFDDPHSELRLYKDVDHLGRRYLRFCHTYKGLPAWPAELIVRLDPDSDVDVMNGVFVPTPRKASTTPVLEATATIARARAEMPGGDKAAASTRSFYAPGDYRPVWPGS